MDKTARCSKNPKKNYDSAGGEPLKFCTYHFHYWERKSLNCTLIPGSGEEKRNEKLEAGYKHKTPEIPIVGAFGLAGCLLTVLCLCIS